MKPHAQFLKDLGACPDAVEFADQHTTLKSAWENCERSDWLLWLLGKTFPHDDKRFRLLTCDFAERVLKIVPEGEDRPRKAIKTARAFLEGNATLDQLREIRRAAYAAALAAYTADAAVYAAASASAYATQVDGLDIPYLAEICSDASASAVFAAALATDARAEERKAQADLIRAAFLWAEVEAAIKAKLGTNIYGRNNERES